MYVAEGTTGGGDAALSDELRVFAECIEDILAATPGLSYQRLDPRPPRRGEPSPTVAFMIETNPVYDLSVWIELTTRSFILRINGRPYVQKRGRTTRFEWWVERRCRELIRLLEGDLRIEHETIATFPAMSRLLAGRDGKWKRIVALENGWVAAISFLLPYGWLLGRTRTLEYADWHDVD